MDKISFSKINPIRFGDFEATPERISTETKLRIQSLKFESEQDIIDAKNLLSSVFGAKSEQVRQFMDENMWPNDLMELQIYLTQGPQGYAKMQKVTEQAMSEAMTKAMAEKSGE